MSSAHCQALNRTKAVIQEVELQTLQLLTQEFAKFEVSDGYVPHRMLVQSTHTNLKVDLLAQLAPRQVGLMLNDMLST